MDLKTTYTLSNGVKIEAVGYGTWLIEDQDVEQCCLEAIKIGYRSIDSAQNYKNERGVGEAVRNCGLKRDELFIATKVEAAYKDYQTVKDSIEQSLKTMGLDYVDLLLIHAPQPWDEFGKENRYFKENAEVWKALEEAYKEGKARSIGVSNFRIDDLDYLLAHCEIKPMVNQIRACITSTPFAIIDYCKKNDIVVEAYSPIAHGEILNHEIIQKMAEEYGVSPAQICLKYDLQLGLVVLPKTTNPEHMKTDAELDFTISPADMEKLISLNESEYGVYGF